jgi:hypothetical protein
MKKNLCLICAIFGLLLAGCATQKPYDYTALRAHPPRSILVLPPVSTGIDIKGSYGYLSTVTMPLAEKGYYVYPVRVVDELMKENGLPTPGDMRQAPLDKIAANIGADSVLYIDLIDYGSSYIVISSVTTVTANARLVDVKTGTQIWDGNIHLQINDSGGGGNIIGQLVAAAVDQIINSAVDRAHDVSRLANAQLIMNKDTGLLNGPYVPETK